jgi:hypothetical protein
VRILTDEILIIDGYCRKSFQILTPRRLLTLGPDLFEANTACGHYQGVTDQVGMSVTPEHYDIPLVPRGSSKAEWLPR